MISWVDPGGATAFRRKIQLAIIQLVAAGGLLARAAEGDAALAGFFREYLEASFRLRPTMGTSLGDHSRDGELDDVTAAGRGRWRAHQQNTLDNLPARVDFRSLSRAGQIDYEILEHDLRASLWHRENFEPFVIDPRTYNEYISGSVFSLLTQSTLPRETNVANAIARIRQVPSVIAAAKASLQNPPLVYVETAIQQNKGSISFYEKDVVELAGRTRQLKELKAAAAQVVPVLKEYQQFLENDLRPRARGEWRIGREKFARKFELETDAGLSADQVYADAQAEFERVRRDMYVLARQAWAHYMGSQPLPPDDANGRRETVQRVLASIGREHGKPDQIVRDVKATVADIKKFIAANDILRLPEPDLCRIIEMPEFQRGNSTAYMNSPPPLDAQAIGQYAVSPPPRHWDAARVRSYLEEYNRHMLQVLTIHEAYPGHYVQMEYANRNPSLIRKVLGSGVFVEGWAVYTEQMMLDQGYGAGSLALRLSQLKFYLRAVANAILDHRMHCEEMSDEEAMDLLVKEAFQSEGEARLKVIRAKQSSVQLSTYFTGRMAHYRLRQEVQRELGERFVLGRYHEAVLANGSIPVKYLAELVRKELAMTRVKSQP